MIKFEARTSVVNREQIVKLLGELYIPEPLFC